MKKFKKILLFILVFAFLITLFSGCGASKEVPAAPNQSKEAAKAVTEAPKAEPVEIQFWDMVWGPKEYIETASKLVDKYNSEHKDVKVKYQSTPWNNWYQTFATAIASGSAPDISTGAGYQAFQFAKIGEILPVDDVVEDLKKSGVYSDFTNNCVEMMKYDGHYVSVPDQRDIRAFWYNKDLFDKAGVQSPKNWNELKEVAKKLTKGDVYGLAMGGANNNGVHFIVTMMINNGGGLFDKDRKVAVTGDRNKETFKFISELAKDGTINPASAGFSDDDGEKSFISGKAAMYLGTPSLDEKYPEMKGKIFVMNAMEGLHGDKGTLNWVNNIMLYKQSKHPKETKEFLKWWLDNKKALFTEGRVTALPARTSFMKDEFFTKDPNKAAIINEYLPVAKSMAAASDQLFPELNEIDGDSSLRNAIQGLILKKDPDKILNDLQGAIEGIMKKSK